MGGEEEIWMQSLIASLISAVMLTMALFTMIIMVIVTCR